MSDAAEILRARGVGAIDIAIVLGTGLGAIADAVENPITVSYADLPGFPRGTVSGHAHELVCGTLEGRRVAVMKGRGHYYETGDAAVMRPAIATFAALGARMLLLTNSAGSVHAEWQPGSLAIIADHINLSGVQPLIGDASDKRFVNLVDVYDRHLRARLKAAAAIAHIAIHEGVYMLFPGPSFETPAEIRATKVLGADLVGMSTVPEAILARYHGMRVVAVSTITNFAAGIAGGSPSHTETKDTALGGAVSLQRLIRLFLRASDD